MLGRLAAALDGLGRRLGLQRDSMLDASGLAPRAEEAAIRARLLAFGCGDAAGEVATALAADIGALAQHAEELAEAAAQAAETGGRTAEAIAGHAATLATAATLPPGEADPATLRRLLAPLVATLEGLPAQRRAQGEVGQGLMRLAEEAMPLAERVDRFAGLEGAAAGEEALRLSRALGALATAAARIAADVERDGGSGAAIAAAMAGEIRDIASAGPTVAAPLPEPPRPVQLGMPRPERRFGRAAVWTGARRLD